MPEPTPDEIAALPAGSGTWVLALRALPVTVMEPEPHHPMIALCVDLLGGDVLHHCVVDGDDAEEALRCVTVAMRDPLVGAPRRPAALRVEDDALAGPLREALSVLGVSVDVGDAPGVDALVAGIARAHVDDAPARSYLEGGTTVEQVRLLFEASRRLHALRPWELAAPPLVFAVDLGAFGYDVAAVVLTHDDGPGVLIFERVKDFVRFRAQARAPGALAASPRVGVLALYMVGAEELGAPRLQETQRHGWPHPEGLYPEIVHADPERDRWTPRPDDLAATTACCSALAAFLHARPDALLPARDKQIACTVVPRERMEVGEVEVRYPHERWRV